MNSQKMMNLVLVLSLLLNIAMVAGIFWMGRNSQGTIMKVISDNATEQIAMQQRVLDDISSKDRNRMDALVSWLQVNMDAQSRIRYKADTGDR